MNRRKVSVAFLLVYSALFSVNLHASSEPVYSRDNSANFLADQTLLSRNDINLSGDKFYQAWLSKDDERERMKANMYLLGVIDASEGTRWCSYSAALPDTLRENIYSFFQHLPKERLKERASKLIIEALEIRLPCSK
ncbi:Rap1a/Tai family immunity protein [Mangrovibacter sp. MFB070]|uniref:Rap1a/Tai family immunity protein n=1 Tax=Mangrovibacter sp. MFB070 TaxID=1224318 RepID=UPI001F409200|nr:Rap1a/Tai family immunity protein [Mangrovibacter sp. MFB070]